MPGHDHIGLAPGPFLGERRRRSRHRTAAHIARLLQSDRERIQPFEVRQNLLRVLFGRPANILMVGLTIFVSGLFGFLRGDGAGWLIVGIGAFLLIISRCAMILTFNKRYTHQPCTDPEPWIAGFGLAAILTSSIWGAFTFCSLALSNDTVLFTLTIVTNVGTAGAIAARNAAAPRIAKLQLLATLLPIMAGSFFAQDHSYRLFVLLIPALIYGLFVLIADLYDRLVELFRSQVKLSALSNIDPLTHIPNRRCFAARSLDALHNCRLNRQPLAVLMIDVDYFKPFNDHYGHQAGDLCLQQVAAILQDNLRNSDEFIARYGGEEFAVYLINAGPAEAEDVAQRLCNAVANAALTHASRPDTTTIVTVSIGLVATDQLHTGLDALVNTADQALYRAKTTGRNQVAVAPGYDVEGGVGWS